MRTLKRKTLAIAGTFALLFGGTANADLLEYSFTGADGSQRTLSPSAAYANPTGTMTFALSAGVDRKVRLSILNSSGDTISTTTGQLLGANDRITVGGSEYYGEFLTAPAPGVDGEYTIRAEILSGDGESVKVDDHALIIDTTPPSIDSTPVQNQYRRFFTEQWNVVQPNRILDLTAPINYEGARPAKAEIHSVARKDGSKGVQTGLNVTSSEVSATLSRGSDLWPHRESWYDLTLVVYDEAGNKAETSWAAKFDGIGHSYEVVGITYDGTGKSRPWGNTPSLSEFVAYEDGIIIDNYNPRFLLKVKKADLYPFNEFGLYSAHNCGAIYNCYPGRYEVLHEDGDDAYVATSNGTLRQHESGSYRVMFSDVGSNDLNTTVYVGAKESVPVRVGFTVSQVEYTDGTTSGYSAQRNGDQQHLYKSISGSLDSPQKFDLILKDGMGSASKIIPAGQTEFTLDTPPKYTRYWAVHVCTNTTPQVCNTDHTSITIDQHDPRLLNWEFSDSGKGRISAEIEEEYSSTSGIFGMKRAQIIAENKNTGEITNISHQSYSQSANNHYYEFALEELPTGPYKLSLYTEDKFGNAADFYLMDRGIDSDAPSVEIKANGSEGISSLDQFLIAVSDTEDPEPKITSIRLEGGPASDRVQLSWRESSPGVFALEYPIMFPSLKEGEEYTLTVTAEDAQGNATTESAGFMYEPLQMSLADGMDGKLMLPAVAQEFQRQGGGNIIQTEPITLGGDTVVSGTYDVFATLRSDAEIPLVVNGIRIEPGQTMSVMSQHDFGSSGGRIDLPLRPAVADVEGSSNLLVMTSAPNSPVLVLDVNTWIGKAKLSAESWDVRQVIDPVSISASPETGVVCRLTSDDAAAKEADPVRDPVCLLEWEQIPDEAEPVEGQVGGLKLNGLQGQAVALGEQPVSYSLYLYSGDGRKIRVGGGNRTLNVGSAFGSVAYKPMGELAQVHRVIEEFDVRLKQSVGPACSLTLDAVRAQDAASMRQVGDRSNTCLFEWIDIPDGMQQDTYSESPSLFGTLREAQPHTLRWRVSIFTKNGTRVTLATESHDIEAVDPPTPTVEVMSNYHYEGDLFMVPMDGGYLGDAIIEGEPSPLDVFMTRDGDELTNETFEPGRSVYNKIFRRMETESSDLWAETVFNIEAAYNLLPEVGVKKVLRAVAVPGYDIRPQIDVGVSEALDTAPLPVTISMSDRLNPDAAYDPGTMGEWEIRLVREESFDEVVPMTDYVAAPSGEVQFSLDLAGIERSVRLVAQARLKSPIEGYERVENSQRVFLSVLRGGAIDAGVEGRRLAGAAPFSTVLQLALDNRADMAAAGDVHWEISADGGSSWESHRVTDRNRFRWYKTYDKGEYLVRAKVLNVNSGAESYTETIEVIAYDTPTVEIEGPRTLFVGAEANYTVKATGPDGEPMDNAVIKWTQDRGETFFHEGATLTMNSEEAKRYSMEAWVRDETAPDDDRYSYTRERVYADFRPIKGPRVFMTGPRVIETGEEYEYIVRLSLPYRGMEGEVEGYFTLPNGEQVEGDTLTYSPTEEDLALGSMELHYTAWVKGYRDQGTEASQDIRARVWEYVWPDFNLYMRGSADMAPAEVTARVREIAFRGQLDEPTYQWEFPAGEGFVETESRWDDMRTFQITEPGTYTVKVTISDARGNESVIEETLEIGEAPPYDVQINYSASNDYSREPLELRMRPYVTGGHPRDRVEERIYRVNGQEVESSGYSARATLEQGSHEVALTIRTRMGKEVTQTLTMDVAENQPPVCSVRVDDRYSSWAMFAECEDVDGDMDAFEWTVNGNPVSVRSNRLTLTKSTYDDELPLIELVGYDDAGDPSAKVSAQ